MPVKDAHCMAAVVGVSRRVALSAFLHTWPLRSLKELPRPASLRSSRA